MAPPREPVYSKDEKVLCFHHELLYEAKVLDSRHSDASDKKSPLQYRVHYKGWKNTWDDWVPQDRLRKLNEENKQLAQALKHEMDDQNSRTATKSASKKKKTAGSDLGSTRGSEDRQSLPPTGRGQKRGRENDIEKVSDNPSIVPPAPSAPTSTDHETGTTAGPSSGPTPAATGTTTGTATENTSEAQPLDTGLRRSKRIVKPTAKAVVPAKAQKTTTAKPLKKKPTSKAADTENAVTAQSNDDQPAVKKVRTATRLKTPKSAPPKKTKATGKKAQPKKAQPKKAQTPPTSANAEVVKDEVVASSSAAIEQPTTENVQEPPLVPDEAQASSAAIDQPSSENVQASSSATGPGRALRKRSAPPSKGPPGKKAKTASGAKAPESGSNEPSGKDEHSNTANPSANNSTVIPPETVFDDFKRYKEGGDLYDKEREIDVAFWEQEAADVAKFGPQQAWFPPAAEFPSGASYTEHDRTSNGLDWSGTQLRSILDETADTPVRLRDEVQHLDEYEKLVQTSSIRDSPKPQAVAASDTDSSSSLSELGATPEPVDIQLLTQAESSNAATEARQAQKPKSQRGRKVRAPVAPKGPAYKSIPSTRYRVLDNTEVEPLTEPQVDALAKSLRDKKKRVLGTSHQQHLATYNGVRQHHRLVRTKAKEPANLAKQMFFSEVDPNKRVLTAGYQPENPPEDMMREFQIKKTKYESTQNNKEDNANQAREQEEHFNARPAVKIEVPDHIKSLLVDDWENVTKNLWILPVPSPHPVSEILTTYFNEEKGHRRLGSAEADLLEEVVQGLKGYFEKCLGKILLYRFEREQYFRVRQAMDRGDPDFVDKTVADLYGAEHLCRLIVSLPELIAQTNMTAQSIAKLRSEMQRLSTWLGRNSIRFFTAEYEPASSEYIEKVRDG